MDPKEQKVLHDTEDRQVGETSRDRPDYVIQTTPLHQRVNEKDKKCPPYDWEDRESIDTVPYASLRLSSCTLHSIVLVMPMVLNSILSPSLALSS